MMKKGGRICVIGGGVIGLTTALVLAQKYPVTVIADKFSTETESIKATAVWHIYLVSETEKVLSWAACTLSELTKISEIYPKSGVQLIKGVELFRITPFSIPSWSNIPNNFQLLSASEVESYNIRGNSHTSSAAYRLNEHPVTWGYNIQAPAADMSIYLNWLKENLAKSSNVELVTRHLKDIRQLDGQFDVVVNCTSLGARELVGDADFEPYKGQYFVLKSGANSPTEYVGDDDHPGGMAYVIPRNGEVMVGGCAEKGIWDLDLTLSWQETFVRAGLFVPWLQAQTDVNFARPPVVGIRPCRTQGIRLEIDNAVAGMPVIHNYGHAGSGFSLSWGCANTVLQLVGELT